MTVAAAAPRKPQVAAPVGATVRALPVLLLLMLLAGCAHPARTPDPGPAPPTGPGPQPLPRLLNLNNASLRLELGPGQAAGAILATVDIGFGSSGDLHGNLSGLPDDAWASVVAYAVRPDGLHFRGASSGAGDRSFSLFIPTPCPGASTDRLLVLVGREATNGTLAVRLGNGAGTPTAWNATGPAAAIAAYAERNGRAVLAHGMGVNDTRRHLPGPFPYFAGGALRLDAQAPGLAGPRFDYGVLQDYGGGVAAGNYTLMAPTDAGPLASSGPFLTYLQVEVHQAEAREPLRHPATLALQPATDTDSDWATYAGSFRLDLSGLGLPREEPAFRTSFFTDAPQACTPA